MKSNAAKQNVPFANTYWIVHDLFLAGEHPAELDSDGTLTKVSALLDVGIRTFINLTEEKETTSYDDLLRTVARDRKLEVSVIRIPIRDRGVAPLETLKRILDEIDRSTTKGNPVFVHCFAGIGRTGTVVGCYLRRHQLAPQGEVVAKITNLRRLMPGGREISPHTPEQIQLVELWSDGG